MSKTIRHLLEPLVISIGKKLKLPDNLPNYICTDSRKVYENCWFLPIVGEKFDGHDYIAAVMEQGAAGFFYEQSKEGQVPTKFLDFGIAVNDSLLFFQSLAKYWRLSFKYLQLVAITGSSGKTTAKEMTTQLLSEVGNVLSTQGSFNNEIGVPITLCQLNESHNFAVIEMGARKPGDIRFLVEIAQPNIGVVLNIGNAHIGEFGSAENLRMTKQEMFTASKPQVIGICPGSDERACSTARENLNQVITFGDGASDTIRIMNYRASQKGRLTLDLVVDKEPASIDFPAFHLAYPINIAASCAIAHALGINVKDMKLGLEKFKAVPGRFLIHRNQINIIDDTYNANPDSMVMGIDSAAICFASSKTMFVLGDMLELGHESSKYHQEIGAQCAKHKPKVLVAVGDFCQNYRNGALLEGLPDSSIFCFRNVEDLLAGYPDLPSCDTVFAKGSRGAQLDKFVNYLLKLGN